MPGKTSLPVRELDFKVTAEQESVLVTTYTPKAEFNVTYYKSVQKACHSSRVRRFIDQ
jgi:hypothetical protein